MKKQNPKKPAAKPAKTPKPTTAPPAGAADALALTPDGIRAALGAWMDAPPVALPTPPPALDAAVRSLLAAARLDPPGSAVPEGLAGCFVRLLDEWKRKAAADDWPEYADALAADREAEADARAALAARGENPDALLAHGGPFEWSWQALEEVAFSRDWRSYRLAQVARLSRETIRRAVAALGGLSPDAAREAAQRSQARFALAGAEMMWYRGTQLPPPGADFDKAGEQRRELLEAAVRRALDELDGAARACAATPAANPAPPPEPPPAKTKRSKRPDWGPEALAMARAFEQALPPMLRPEDSPLKGGKLDTRGIVGGWKTVRKCFDRWSARAGADMPGLRGFPRGADAEEKALRSLFRALKDSTR